MEYHSELLSFCAIEWDFLKIQTLKLFTMLY